VEYAEKSLVFGWDAVEFEVFEVGFGEEGFIVDLLFLAFGL
jgi:hypothetical protein